MAGQFEFVPIRVFLGLSVFIPSRFNMRGDRHVRRIGSTLTGPFAERVRIPRDTSIPMILIFQKHVPAQD
jgi:hypothetical protein